MIKITGLGGELLINSKQFIVKAKSNDAGREARQHTEPVIKLESTYVIYDSSYKNNHNFQTVL